MSWFDSTVSIQDRGWTLYNYNQNWGFTSFDNIGTALVAIFLAITFQGWTQTM